jgi:hypothetical protein
MKGKTPVAVSVVGEEEGLSDMYRMVELVGVGMKRALPLFKDFPRPCHHSDKKEVQGEEEEKKAKQVWLCNPDDKVEVLGAEREEEVKI